MAVSVSQREAEERAQFMLRMRAKGVGDLRLLRALERAPRSLFMPQRYADIANRDIALPIGCGQTAPPPSVVAAMIEALGVKSGDRVLEIGTGSGYAAALLAQLGGDVVSLERCQSLAVEASARLTAFGVDSVKVLFADGLAFDAADGAFDAILVHALIEAPASQWMRKLAPEGALVGAIADEGAGEQRIIRLSRGASGDVEANAMGLARTLMPLVPGLARAL